MSIICSLKHLIFFILFILEQKQKHPPTAFESGVFIA